MKRKPLISLPLFAVLFSGLAGCNSADDHSSTSNPSSSEPSSEPTSEPTSESSSESSSDPGYVVSEKAMDNFLDKIEEESYTIVGIDGILTTSYTDQNMITWFYLPGATHYDDHFAVTVNDETFFGFIDNDKKSLEEISFVDKITAARAYESYLPTAFNSNAVSGGNI